MFHNSRRSIPPSPPIRAPAAGASACHLHGVVGVLGFLVVPPVLKSVLLSKLGEALHRDVAIESISLNPYT